MIEPARRASDEQGVEPAYRPYGRFATLVVAAAVLGCTAFADRAEAAPASRSVVTKRAGEQYVASARVRAPARSRLCIRATERAGRAVVGNGGRCVRSTGRWQRIEPLLYESRRAGSRLRVTVTKRARVDSLRIAPAGRKPCNTRRSCQQPPPPPAPAPPPPPGPPPPPPPAGGGPAVGAQFHCAWSFYTNPSRAAVLDELAAAGVRWVRIDVAWDGIEDSVKGARNPWYIAMVDYCVDQARMRNLNVLVTLWLTPGWANGGRSNNVPPTNPQDYADFARWAASHWAGRVAAWEVWNEPDPSQTFWQGSVQQYVSLLRAAYPAFKAGDPAAKVILGGPASNDDGWIGQVYRLGARGSFDVLATHPYQAIADAPPERADDGNRWWFTHLPAVRNVMIANGDGNKPVWFTEFGWSAHANSPDTPNWQRGVTPEQQADYFIRAIRYTTANYAYVPVMFWYKERARPGSGDAHQEGYALLNGDLSRRPVYTRLKSFLTG